MPNPLPWIAVLVVPYLVANATGNNLATLLSIVAVPVVNGLIWDLRKQIYFQSDHFRTLRDDIASVVAEHNEVVDYVAQIRSAGSFSLGASSSGENAHLAEFENTSTWNVNRSRNVAEYAPHIHNASLQVVRNASMDPLKYLMKYFGIKADRETLADVQRLDESVVRLEEAIGNVKARESAITASIAPPGFILERYADEYWQQVGVQLSPVEVPYLQYKFQYTSAGGNSGQTTTIELDSTTLEALSTLIVEKIRWAKSAAGQRALMTNRLRNEIKTRDGYACKTCGVSVEAEPHLLLEVDHIVPVSKGGLSTPDNLQTLCWRCNRSKGAKLDVGLSNQQQGLAAG